MKTELQQLEENAKIQYAKERVEELGSELNTLLDQAREMKRWERRTMNLNIFGIAIYLAALAYAGYADLPETVTVGLANYWLMIFFFLIIRENYFGRKFEYLDGKIDGIFAALELLYPDSVDRSGGNARRKVKRPSMFKRFKEFFERVGQSKSKEVPA